MFAFKRQLTPGNKKHLPLSVISIEGRILKPFMFVWNGDSSF
jgi:hypothetical protein